MTHDLCAENEKQKGKEVRWLRIEKQTEGQAGLNDQVDYEVVRPTPGERRLAEKQDQPD